MGLLLKSTTTTPTEGGPWIPGGSIGAVAEEDVEKS